MKEAAMPMPPDHNVLGIPVAPYGRRAICLRDESRLVTLPWRTDKQKSRYFLIFQALDSLVDKVARDKHAARRRIYRLSLGRWSAMFPFDAMRFAVVDDENMAFHDFSFGIRGFFQALKYLRVARNAYSLAYQA
jgi:hypothetical protein